jgi:hypothetical protein
MELLFNLSLEMALFAGLGMLYYFYQKRKILRYEEEKVTYLMGLILEASLSERENSPSDQLDPLIEAIDDFLHNRSSTPPYELIRTCAGNTSFSEEYRSVLKESLLELDEEK